MGCHQLIADAGDYAPGGEICWFGVNFPKDLKCQILSSLTVEIAFKRRKQAIKYQCWCGVNFPRDLKCQILSSLTLEIAFKRRKEAPYFIDLLIIENVELLNLKGFCGESVLCRRNWTCHLHDV